MLAGRQHHQDGEDDVDAAADDDDNDDDDVDDKAVYSDAHSAPPRTLWLQRLRPHHKTSGQASPWF